MIPVFPRFKNLQLKDKQEVEKFVKNYPPYSDYNFVSLWSWNTQGKTQISQLNGNLLARFNDYETSEPFYSFLGNKKAIATIRKLLELSIKKGLKPELKLIPEINVSKNRKRIKANFKLKQDRANFDYTLSIKETSELKGGKYCNHRNLVNRFKRKFPNHSIRLLNLQDREAWKNIKRLFALWVKIKKKTQKESENEFKAIKRHVKLSRNYNILALGVYIDNKLVAFSTNEVIYKPYAIAHFRKANTQYAGLYQFQEQETAKYLLKKGCRYLNYEQDLGIKNLRRSKRSWNPVKYFKKYTIRLKK